MIEVFFDNVHFFRDNPNVESDIEQIPALENFIESNGTLLSNNHTPLIAHTATTSITDYTGLYGDRQGMGISNDYEVYNASHNDVNPNRLVRIPAPTPSIQGTAGNETLPNQPYSPTVPATQTQVNGQEAQDPAPWVPFTRGRAATRLACRRPTWSSRTSSPTSPTSTARAPPSRPRSTPTPALQDQETADYVGLTVHCAPGSAFCSTAKAVKYGQSTPSSTATADPLPTEPGGYTGFQQLGGHKYLQPQVTSIIAADTGASSTANLTDGDGNQVTDSAGNLIDLFGNEMDGDYVSGPGLPRIRRHHRRPVPGLHRRPAGRRCAGHLRVHLGHARGEDLPGQLVPGAGTGSPPSSCTTAGAQDGYGLGPGDPCYTYNASQYNAAFTSFFNRLSSEGINTSNTTFLFSADEGDHFNGANVGRAIAPTCTGTAGTTSYSCTYPAGSIGEVDTSLHGLLADEKGDTTGFYVEPQGAAIYPTGSPSTSTVRQLERDTGSSDG